MKTIWKFEIHPGITLLEMPSGAEPIHVAEQARGRLMLWAKVESMNTPDGKTAVHTIATGGRVNMADKYIGTVVMQSGLVWHVFVE